MQNPTQDDLDSLPVAAAEKKHAPFGRPRMLQPDRSYCILHQEGFIQGYGADALMPLWSSFTIDGPVSVSTVKTGWVVFNIKGFKSVRSLDRPQLDLQISPHESKFICLNHHSTKLRRVKKQRLTVFPFL